MQQREAHTKDMSNSPAPTTVSVLAIDVRVGDQILTVTDTSAWLGPIVTANTSCGPNGGAGVGFRKISTINGGIRYLADTDIVEVGA